SCGVRSVATSPSCGDGSPTERRAASPAFSPCSILVGTAQSLGSQILHAEASPVAISHCVQCNRRLNNRVTCSHCQAVLCSYNCASKHVRMVHGAAFKKRGNLVANVVGAIMLLGCAGGCA